MEKCSFCNKKLKLISYSCKCNDKFCQIHRYTHTYKDKYVFPENYKELFNKSYEIFMMYKDKLSKDDFKLYESNKDIGQLIKFLVSDIEMNELLVQKAIKKLQNTLG